MSPKPNTQNWNDVQTALATAAIVTTLGMWNFFATPAKTEAVQVEEPDPIVPPSEAPTELPVAAAPTTMPQVKIMFTPASPQVTPVVEQTQEKKKKKKKNNANGGVPVQTVTQTQSS